MGAYVTDGCLDLLLRDAAQVVGEHAVGHALPWQRGLRAVIRADDVQRPVARLRLARGPVQLGNTVPDGAKSDDDGCLVLHVRPLSGRACFTLERRRIATTGVVTMVR